MKKIANLLLVTAMICCIGVTTAFAAETDYTNGTVVSYIGTGTEEYTVAVPASMIPGQTITDGVSANGTFNSTKTLKVTADETVTLTNSINKNDTRVLNIAFDGIELAGSNTVEVSDAADISVADIEDALFGTWSGKFNYNVELVENSTGTIHQKPEPILAANSTWFNPPADSGITRASITEIDIKNTYTPSGTENVDYVSWDASEGQVGTVTAYVEGTKLTIAGNGYGCIYANPDSSSVFANFTSLQEVNFDNNFNMSKATTMQNFFASCSALTDADVGKFDTSNVTNMRQAFYCCTSLETLDVSTWDTSKVTTFYGMFGGHDELGDMQLKNLDVSDWDTSSATNMRSVFYGCGQLTELDLSNWDVSNVTTMYHMFADCFKLEHIDFSGWNTNSLTDLNGFFNDCHALEIVDISMFDTSKVYSFTQMFERCINLKTIIGIEDLDTSSAGTETNKSDFHSMFMNCESLTSLDLSKWDTSKAAWFTQMFKNCYSLKDLDVSTWDTSSARYSFELFYRCDSLTELNLSSWDTSSIQSMYNMFLGCGNLRTIYVSDKWSTVSLLEDDYRSNIFAWCSSLVGGAGTTYASNHADYTVDENGAAVSVVDVQYAHIDEGTSNPGYLTSILDKK